MSKNLDELYERLSWCRAQITILSAEVQLFVKDGAYKITTETDASGATTVFAQAGKQVPRTVRIHAGAIINELRSTLDGLACTLAIRNGKSPKDVYFPISANTAVFATDGRKKIAKLQPDHQEAIAALKPYFGGNNLLFGLHMADRLRKHQRLVLASAGIGSFGISEGVIGSLRFFGGGPLTEVRKPILTYSADTRIRGSLEFSLAFDEPEALAGKDLIGTLNEFGNLVQSVIDLFA